jgi:hypothetical protein
MLPPPKRVHRSTTSGKNDWNTHRETIERLYITENKPLKDIKVHMEEHFGFTPVEDRAYEKAFRRLGLSKNIPAQTMEAIVKAIDDRKEGGKATAVYWRGQRVDEKRIHRFRQRLARETKVDPQEFLSHPQARTCKSHRFCLDAFLTRDQSTFRNMFVAKHPTMLPNRSCHQTTTVRARVLIPVALLLRTKTSKKDRPSATLAPCAANGS